MNNLNVKVGDKVVLYNHFGCALSVGIVVKITEKSKDIVVDFGQYKETFSSDGWGKDRDIWYSSQIFLLTPEIEKQLRQERIIRKCRDTFGKKKDLTFEQAEKILKILETE